MEIDQEGSPKTVRVRNIFITIILLILVMVLVGWGYYFISGKNKSVGRVENIPTPSIVQKKSVRENWVNYPNINRIDDFLPDKDILWVSTRGGVVKVDKNTGLATSIFTMADGLSSNSITDIERQDNYLWIATQGGISRLDLSLNTWKHYTVDNGLVNGSNIGFLLFQGQLWYYTFDGIGKYDSANDKWINYFQKLGNASLFVSEDKLWVCINCHNRSQINRLGYFDPKTANWIMKVIDNKTLENKDVQYTIKTAPDGQALLQTDEISEELVKKGDLSFKYSYLKSKIKSLIGERDDPSWDLRLFINPYLLITTYSNDVFYLYNSFKDTLEEIKPKFIETSKGEKCMLSRLYSLSGFRKIGDLIWFHNGDTICNLNLQTKEIKPFPINISMPQFGNILATLNDKLIIYKKGELIIFNTTTNEEEILTGINQKITGISLMCPDCTLFYPQISVDEKRNMLYLFYLPPGGEGQTEEPSLWEYNIKNKLLQNIPFLITPEISLKDYQQGAGLTGQIVQDKLYLIIRNSKLIFYDVVNNRWEIVIPDIKTHFIIASSDSTMWVDTEKGIGKLVDGKVELLSVQPSEKKDDSLKGYSLVVDKNLLWAYTGKKLFFYDSKSNTFKDITSAIPSGPAEYEPFHDNWRGNPSVERYGSINIVRYVNGTLWVGTSSGLVELNLIANKWKLHNSANGMMGNNITYLAFIENKPVIATSGGLSILK